MSSKKRNGEQRDYTLNDSGAATAIASNNIFYFVLNG